ncbi:phosphomethylpyrimidine synthase ThiC [Methanohalophilus halophilus]|uniref:Phosphomethylpyrimidine synthase n=1 Tax=Methanohalophilus halophilus TaxID=2177 RepID=A0A1L3Q1K4_9EURY|nr:phosphomethylpyrimidine synthase ThiC [Methanohalophilus halophilus]APH38747.1 phosphomethylpyrimidine synthase [Methanohalophilus halophilus]RNI07941.1 phosphomethylpyrimidine synthase ThiC [Methanohalophilus halophilus]SDW74486.1 phosphomethylpyrimidine synthase [Methanohalophilus halophilus]
MLTQIDHAKNGELTAEMQQVAVQENMDSGTVLSRVLGGSLVIMTRQGNPPVAIGEGATTKINVNLGSSAASIDPSSEIEKARIAEKYGADTITDLSMGGDIQQIRKAIIENTTLPLTTVPVYQAVVECGLKNVTSADILSYLRSQVAEGISSVVLHCVEKQMLEKVKGSGRLMGMVSKGGSFTSVFMLVSGCENPFLENFDEVMEILRDKDVVLSLGNTMRSGCIHDRPDQAQLMEMENNAALAKRANECGVQVIIEGMGGHVAASSIPEYVGTYRSKSCHPLFVAGPLPTDIALGYDHIAGAVGASMASGAGADYLCYITPSEHLSLPTPDQVREGLVAFKIAAHIGDSMKYGMAEKDRLLAKRRASFDWEGQMELAFDPDRPRDFCPMEGPCSMCGEYCAIQIMGEYLAEGE